MSRHSTHQPRSIHDADTPEAQQARQRAGQRRGRRGRLLIGAAAVLAVAAAGGAYYATTGRGSTSGGGVPDASPSGSVLSTAPGAPGAGKHVDVLIDGWSLQTLGTSNLTYTTGSSPAPVVWQAATTSDLAALLSSTPDAVTQLLARMVTDDPALACTTSGCTDSHGPVDPDVLLKPASIPHLGASYAGYGITAGVYVAQLPVNKGDTSVTLSGTGVAPLTVSATPIPAEYAPADGTGKRTPDAANGYLRARYLIAAGLGHLFAPSAAWLGTKASDPTEYLADQGANPPAGTATQLQASSPQLIATTGLSGDLPVADSWSASHLTYATSPSTGCGQEALCVPGAVSPTVGRNTLETATVCNPGDKYQAALAVQDVQLSVTLPAPTHQFGLGASTARWGAPASLVSGTKKIHFVEAALFNGNPATLWVAGGRVDDDAAPSPVSVPDVLANVEFNGQSWHTCGQ